MRILVHVSAPFVLAQAHWIPLGSDILTKGKFQTSLRSAKYLAWNKTEIRLRTSIVFNDYDVQSFAEFTRAIVESQLHLQTTYQLHSPSVEETFARCPTFQTANAIRTLVIAIRNQSFEPIMLTRLLLWRFLHLACSLSLARAFHQLINSPIFIKQKMNRQNPILNQLKRRFPKTRSYFRAK